MLEIKIKKRSGNVENYNAEKLQNSIKQSVLKAGLKDNPISARITREVEKYLVKNYGEEIELTSDDIRAAVNIVLLENNLPQVAKVYFLTRDAKQPSNEEALRGAKKIKKRDGSIVDFDKYKIFNAVNKAGKATGEFDETEAKQLSDIVTSVLEHKFSENQIPNVEQIQDIIEIILIQANWARTAKAFILYREQRKKVRLEQGKEVTSPEVKKLEEHGVYLSKQARHILNNSTSFDVLGRIIFLDRYSIKDKREDIGVGDLVIVISKEDRKYPKKDLGVIKQMLQGDRVVLHMITGMYAEQGNNFEFEQDLFKCDKPRESIDDAHRRVAKAVASVEKSDDDKEKYREQFYEQLSARRIQPAGRIMTAANVDKHGNYTSNLTLYNCYVIPCPEDSRVGIVKKTLFQMIEIMSRGGGVGIALNTLRPKYAYVRGVHGKSSGSVSWAGLYSYATGLIEQGGSRRGALMLMQWDWHPDVLEFIDSKRKAGQIENANISVMVSDSFMEAVKKDGYWNLEFPDYENPTYNEIYHNEWNGDLQEWKAAGYPTRVYKTLKARDMWRKIVESAHASAEPGVVFMERYNKISNSWYFNKVICTNPCGEQGLPGWGVCNLGHLYLASFAKEVGRDEIGPVYEMDWDELKKSARILARFLDNVIDLTPYHFEENEKNQKSERRVGGGTLGLGELLIKMRVKYGSDESLQFIDRVYGTIAKEMYSSSSDIAKEKGSFPKFNAEKFLQSGFMKTMPEDIREKVRTQGIRNVTLTTQAPTGTVGSMLGTSTGIEPYYAFKFFRQSRLGFHEVMIPLAESYSKDGETLPEFFACALDLTPLEHIKVQAAVQKWTDSSISKTANAPADYTVEQTAALYEKAYELGCKGVTIYRDNSRSEQVLSLDKDTEKKNLAYNGAKQEAVKDRPQGDHPASGKINPFKELVTVEVPEMQNPQKHMEMSMEESAKYGSGVGKICPQCKQGVMVKLGGCTECSKQCGFKGSCDIK